MVVPGKKNTQVECHDPRAYITNGKSWSVKAIVKKLRTDYAKIIDKE